MTVNEDWQVVAEKKVIYVRKKHWSLFNRVIINGKYYCMSQMIANGSLISDESVHRSKSGKYTEKSEFTPIYPQNMHMSRPAQGLQFLRCNF